MLLLCSPLKVTFFQLEMKKLGYTTHMVVESVVVVVAGVVLAVVVVACLSKVLPLARV